MKEITDYDKNVNQKRPLLKYLKRHSKMLYSLFWSKDIKSNKVWMFKLLNKHESYILFSQDNISKFYVYVYTVKLTYHYLKKIIDSKILPNVKYIFWFWMLLWTECLCLPPLKFSWSPAHRCDEIRRWSFWELIRFR